MPGKRSTIFPSSMRFILHIIFIMAVGVGWPGAWAQDAPEQKGGFICGLNAAYIFLNRSGHHVAYEELVQDFTAQKLPDSLLAIKNVLEKHGCRTVGVKTDASFFLTNPHPAIVYLQLYGFSRQNEDHFSYLVSASRQTGAKFLDPIFNLNAASYVTWDTFSRIYQGFALIPNE